MPRRALLWVRVSEDKGQTVEGQERELRELAARHGLAVWRVVRVEGRGVFQGDPPEKREVLAMARRREFDVLMVWGLDRWARRRRDGAREVFDVLPGYGVTVVSHEEPWLSTEGIPAGIREALGHLALWLAEEESARKSRRVALRYVTNRNRAAAGGGRARWGRGQVPTPAEEARVRELRAAGWSVRRIAAEVGVPRSTVGDMVSERSRWEGGSAPSGPAERPEGALRTGKEDEER